ncbi:MAG: prolipoprotein diacylglyceryl transferase [Deltaproteobacteria bacterium]|jgi:prolipoprotein diacylglyceryl transferase|nr:prolipoprotein diacylglyceryl transferase [Deltaproteobacteria bacterium]
MPPVWDADPILFTLPGIDWPVRWYGLFFACAFLAGYALFRWQAERGGRGADLAASFIVPGFIGTLLGARLGHILFYNLDYFLADPLWLFRIWEGGLASHGATAGLLLALLWQSRRSRIPFWEMCDRFSFSAAAGAALIRAGNLFNSEIVGRIAPPDSPFGVAFPRYDGLPAPWCPARYPTQILEFLLGTAVLGSLLAADRLLGRERRPRGALAALFLILYFAGRFCVEFLKERQNAADSLLLSRGQILSILPFLAGVSLLAWAFRRRLPAGAAPARPSPGPPGSCRPGGEGRGMGKPGGKAGRGGKGKPGRGGAKRGGGKGPGAPGAGGGGAPPAAGPPGGRREG